jgi:hypothetical protein
VVTQAKPIPGSKKMIALAAQHHHQFLGSVIRLDVQKGEDGLEPITRLTPDVGFPETSEARPHEGRYATPWPITEDIFLVSYLEDSKHLAIYLADSLGGRELIHRVKGESCYSPIPLQPRSTPPVRLDLVEGNGNKQMGIYSIANVYQSRHDIRAAGKVKYLRVNKLNDQVAQICPAPHYVGNAMPVKILGEVPVNDDGSVSFEAPAKEMLQLQLLDKDRKCIMGMRTFIYLQPGEISSCVGCHETRNTAPPQLHPGKMKVHSLTPPKDCNYSGGFSFPKTIQPILDRRCIGCHGLGKNKKKKSTLDLIGHPAVVFAQRQYGAPGMKLIWGPKSHLLLSSYAKIDDCNRQPFNSLPGKYHSPEAKLLPILAKHKNLQLSKEELSSIIRWLDLGGICHGNWSWNRPYMRSFNTEGVARLRKEIARQLGEELSRQPTPALVNTSLIQQSRILKMAMPTNHGGWGQTDRQWSGPKDPDYLKMLELVNGAIVPNKYRDIQGTCGRGTANGCICGSCWVREYYNGDHSVLQMANLYKQLNPDMINHEAVPDSELLRRHGKTWVREDISKLDLDFERGPHQLNQLRSRLIIDKNGGNILISSDTAVSGRHSLKFVDAPKQRAAHTPYMDFNPYPYLAKGKVKISFSMLNSKKAPAKFFFETRSGRVAGANLTVERDGSIRAGKKDLGKIPLGEWVHVEMVLQLGRQADKKYQLTLGIPGRRPLSVEQPYVSPEFNALRWFGFASNTWNKHSVFYIDDLKVNPVISSKSAAVQ